MKKHVEVCWIFIFVIIDCINMRIPTFCHFYNQKRKYDVILYPNAWTMHFTTGSSHISNSRISNHMQSCVIHTNNIIFSFLIIKVTECWNSHVNTINSNKYKYLAKLQHVSITRNRFRPRAGATELSLWNFDTFYSHMKIWIFARNWMR